MSLSLWLKKKAPRSGRRGGSIFQGHVSALTGKRLRRSSPDHIRDRCIPINGSNTRFDGLAIISAKAHADLRQFDDAWRCIDEAIVVVRKNQGKVVGG